MLPLRLGIWSQARQLGPALASKGDAAPDHGQGKARVMSACNQALKHITRALFIFAWGVGYVPDDMAGEQRSCSSTQQMPQTLRQLRQTCQILTSCWSSQSGPGQLPTLMQKPHSRAWVHGDMGCTHLRANSLRLMALVRLLDRDPGDETGARGKRAWSGNFQTSRNASPMFLLADPPCKDTCTTACVGPRLHLHSCLAEAQGCAAALRTVWPQLCAASESSAYKRVSNFSSPQGVRSWQWS